jgi:hypothetical protein
MNYVKTVSINILKLYSNIVEYKTKLIDYKYNFIKKINKYFFANNLISLEFIDVIHNKINILVSNSYINNLNPYRKNIYKIIKNHKNINDGIFVINYCNNHGDIVSYIITSKQYRILTKNKKFILYKSLINFIISLNTKKHNINILHSSINDVEITPFTQQYTCSLHNITVENFAKFLRIKSLIYFDTQKADLIIMDGDLLDEYIFKNNDIISLY